MLVKAKRMGYYDLKRKRENEVFDMSESAMKKDNDGNPILPSWVVSVDAPVPARRGSRQAVEAQPSIVESGEAGRPARRGSRQVAEAQQQILESSGSTGSQEVI